MNECDILFLPRHDGKVRIVSASSLSTFSPASSPIEKGNNESYSKDDIGIQRFFSLVKKYQHDFYTAMKHGDDQECEHIASRMIDVLLNECSPPSKLYARSYYSSNPFSPSAATAAGPAEESSPKCDAHIVSKEGGREWIYLGEGDEAKDIICRAFRTMTFHHRSKTNSCSYIPESPSRYRYSTAMSTKSPRMENAAEKEKNKNEEKKNELEQEEKEDGTDTAVQVLLDLKHAHHSSSTRSILTKKKDEESSNRKDETSRKQKQDEMPLEVILESRNDSFEQSSHRHHCHQDGNERKTYQSMIGSPRRTHNEEETGNDYYCPTAASPEGNDRYRRQQQQGYHCITYNSSPSPPSQYYSPLPSQSYWQQQQQQRFTSPPQGEQPVYIPISSSYDSAHHYSPTMPYMTYTQSTRRDYPDTIACCSSSSWSEDDEEEQDKAMIFRRTNANSSLRDRENIAGKRQHKNIHTLSSKRHKSQKQDKNCCNSHKPSHELNTEISTSSSLKGIKPSQINQYDVLCSINSFSTEKPHILLSIPTGNPSKYPTKQHMGNFSFLTLIKMFRSNFTSSRTNRFEKVKIIQKLMHAVKNTKPESGRFLYWKDDEENEIGKEQREQDEHEEEENDDDNEIHSKEQPERNESQEDYDSQESDNTNKKDNNNEEKSNKHHGTENNKEKASQGRWYEMKEEIAWNIIVDTILSSSKREEGPASNKSMKRKRSKNDSSISARFNIMLQPRIEAHIASSVSGEDKEDEEEKCIDFRDWVPRNNTIRKKNNEDSNENDHHRDDLSIAEKQSLPFSPSLSYDEDEELNSQSYRVRNDKFVYNYRHQRQHQVQHYYSY